MYANKDRRANSIPHTRHHKLWYSEKSTQVQRINAISLHKRDHDVTIYRHSWTDRQYHDGCRSCLVIRCENLFFEPSLKDLELDDRLVTVFKGDFETKIPADVCELSTSFMPKRIIVGLQTIYIACVKKNKLSYWTSVDARRGRH